MRACHDASEDDWTSLTLDVQLHMLEFMDIGGVMAATATCSRWRHAVRSVTSLKLTRAAHANVKTMGMFKSAKYLLAVVLDPDTDEAPTEDQLNFAGCIPFALTALPTLTNLTLQDWDTNENGSHPEVSQCGVGLLSCLCFARRAGSLRNICHIEHGTHTCPVTIVETKVRRIQEGATHIDPEEVDDEVMDEARELCVCQRLFQCMPVRNKIEYIFDHGLCGLLSARTANLLKDPTVAAHLNMQHESCIDVRRRAPCGISDILCEGHHYDTMPRPPPVSFTYFDAIVLACYGDDATSASDYIQAINMLVDAGGVVSEAVCACARSGQLAADLRRDRNFRRWELPRGTLIAWVAGVGGNSHLPGPQRYLDSRLAAHEVRWPELENADSDGEQEGSGESEGESISVELGQGENVPVGEGDEQHEEGAGGAGGEDE